VVVTQETNQPISDIGFQIRRERDARVAGEVMQEQHGVVTAVAAEAENRVGRRRVLGSILAIHVLRFIPGRNINFL
jgi:hypothetical protein